MIQAVLVFKLLRKQGTLLSKFNQTYLILKTEIKKIGSGIQICVPNSKKKITILLKY